MTDPQILALIDVPGHEHCIEVARGTEIRPDDPPIVREVLSGEAG